jgi:hypothetical protein
MFSVILMISALSNSPLAVEMPSFHRFEARLDESGRIVGLFPRKEGIKKELRKLPATPSTAVESRFLSTLVKWRRQKSPTAR